ncbi:TetR/AcrR family transcriptional regulator [Nocardioides sp. zg-536]|uniref:TetR/AcrR family transcriptional regulator n=1 Tax=Nocardioides faecalis TaxID=2803858 RepID=A0A938Y8I9_9ACTN|nr:TetR/AcrR family transcriptional regulator [Nocardioides faecalis]MBM9460133.1 TetR/AcrR family transcriptional regulator [Nocardioides faecalis]QVI60072.1 TetR/AcrR family transcriptional regulator [Nocardioides faecalis]
MPPNRRRRDRDEKLHEIVAAAADLFTELGFEQSSMTRIARAAGVTPNTIYWYVEDKDALLVAALDHLLADALRQLDQAPEAANLVDQVLWTLGHLQRRSNLIGVVHARSEQAEVVANWHEGFHALMDSFVMEGLARQGVPDRELQARARLTTYAVEGMLAHPTDPATARSVLELVLSPGG